MPLKPSNTLLPALTPYVLVVVLVLEIIYGE